MRVDKHKRSPNVSRILQLTVVFTTGRLLLHHAFGVAIFDCAAEVVLRKMTSCQWSPKSASLPNAPCTYINFLSEKKPLHRFPSFFNK
jgi:hypothetical protein